MDQEQETRDMGATMALNNSNLAMLHRLQSRYLANKLRSGSVGGLAQLPIQDSQVDG